MTKFKINLTIILVFFVFISCNNDLEIEINMLEEELIELKKINNLLELKNIIYEARISEILILELNNNTKTNTIILSFENGIYYEIPKDLLIDYEIDNANWLLNLTLNDSTQISTFLLGDSLQLDNIILNPYDISPLTSKVNLKTPVNGKFITKVIGQDGANSNFIIKHDVYTRNHSLNIFGLYADYNNEVELIFTNKDGIERSRYTLNIKTDKIVYEFPEFNVEKYYDNYIQNTLFLINYRAPRFQSTPLMVDGFGKIRWYSDGFTRGGKYGLQLFKNGNIGFGKSGLGQGSIFEYSLMGEMIREYSFYPEFENAHHDVYEMSNGNFLIPVNKVGIETIEDHIIEMDRNSGIIINVWDLREILPMDRYTLRKIADGNDWVHVNAVIHDENDNSIIVSGQTQGVFKISWDNKLKWILSPHKGWSSQYENFLLSNIGGDFEWNFGQHAPNILPNGNILLFDNGFGRNFGSSSTDYSRAVEYSIVENHNGVGGTVNQIWQYGKERGKEMFAPFISDVDYLDNTSSIIITAGSTAFDLNYTDSINISLTRDISRIETRIIEVNKAKEVLFELTLSSEGRAGSTYRAEKLIF